MDADQWSDSPQALKPQTGLPVLLPTWCAESTVRIATACSRARPRVLNGWKEEFWLAWKWFQRMWDKW